MSEEVDNVEATEAVTTEAPTEEVVETTESGKFYDSWADDLKSDPSLAKFKDEQEMFKSYKELQKMVGHKSDIPAPDAEPEKWNEFYGKLGRPEDSKGYELAGEEGNESQQTYLDKVSEVALANNLTKKQAEGLVTGMLEYEAGLSKEAQEVENAKVTDGRKMVADEWGDSMDEMSAGVENILSHYGATPEQVEQITADPVATIIFGKIAKDHEEKSQIGTAFNATQQGIDDQITERQARIREVMRETDGNRKDPRIARELDAIDRLNSKKNS